MTPVENTTFFGIIIDSQLNWKSHIAELTSKISSFKYALRTISELVSQEAAMSSYYAYVFSRIKYGIQMWGNSTEAHRVFKLQKSCLRCIFHLRRRDSCREIYKRKMILTVPAIYILECAVFVKLYYNEIFSTLEIDHQYETRANSSRQLKVPQTASTNVQRGVVTQMVKIYNHLPEEYRVLSIKKFKTTVRSHLLKYGFYSVTEFFECSLFFH